MKRFNPSEFESKWQKVWADEKVYVAKDDSKKPKYYVLDFFPYPSARGLHLGHARNYAITDVVARFRRMAGYEVLHPMGWDSFGLPAENFAIKTGIPPQISVSENEASFKKQFDRLGMSYDWTREFSSTDPKYYRWTQWFFKLLFEKGLAYQKKAAQFWCPFDKTVLANEQVVNGKCERCGTKVTKKELKQWYFKITAYADQLLDDLEGLDWSEGIKAQQRNWIGKSLGAEVDFAVVASSSSRSSRGSMLDSRNDSEKDNIITIFTTRPDTLFGATFMVLAPEHPLVKKITTSKQRENIEQYSVEAAAKTDIDRMDEDREKTGVFTGAYATNPVNGAKIPIWIADYVLWGYGTGAIMAVPAHDERDWAFAKKYDLPIVTVIDQPETATEAGCESGVCYSGEGELVNSGQFNGTPSSDAREQITTWLEQQGIGRAKVNYKMRDWLISRQRYWGAPIPIVFCEKDGAVALPDDQLPLILPPMEDYEPTGDGKSPLAKNSDWVNATCPKCGGPATRETDTMDGFACSSWYFLRFADPHNDKEAFAKNLADQWLPVDMYVGGAEHAVAHLLYARMWTKVIRDAGLINFDEPFQALRNQGMLLAEDGQKISKRKGNAVPPDEVIDSGYGADSLRMIVLFLAPFDQATPWSESGLAGIYRFLGRFWNLVGEILESKNPDQSDDEKVKQIVNRTTKKITEDLTKMQFNTAISALMEAINDLNKLPIAGSEAWKDAAAKLTQLIAPFAPHMAEEIWREQMGQKTSIHISDWPTWNEKYLQTDQMTIAIQVNGKLRGEIVVATDAPQNEIEDLALNHENVAKFVAEKTPTKIIYVPKKIINIVVK